VKTETLYVEDANMDTTIAASRTLAVLAALLLGACASQVPVNIRQAPHGNPSLELVRDNPADYQYRELRWGGEILAVENRANTTLVTVLARPLSKDGDPRFSEDSDGRFIARIPGFLDPDVYKAKRDVTVRGTLAGTETRSVGEFPYLYPVVEVSDWYLWPELADYPAGYRYPWWYYDPWYYDPWYRYPYYPHYWR
jgi:outer membrane lipoprotein